MSWWDDAVGRSADLTRAFTSEDLEAYARLVGDDASTELVPEPLIAGLFSKLLGVDLPGPGTNYLKQQLEFPSRAFVGEIVRATVQIASVRPDKRLVHLSTTCVSGDSRVVCRGQALVLAGGVPLPVQTPSRETDPR